MTALRIAALCLGLTLLPLHARAYDSADAALEQALIDSASTPKDHLALAKYFHAKAEGERQQATEHKNMAATYGGTKLAIAQAQKEHCQKLVTLHESAAAEYDKMAAAHESMAK
jgi:hypothetical protein